MSAVDDDLMHQVRDLNAADLLRLAAMLMDEDLFGLSDEAKRETEATA